MESVNPAGQDKTYHHGWGYEPCQWCRQDESMGGMMPQADRKLIFEQRYSTAQLAQLRCHMLRYSRSIPPGPERNHHLQIAIVPSQAL
jgi:hypothetical protein